nr:integrase, catalytic region, zinc finger, CCHC-type, peptidase aspartic, catalytic [Tanacetum cinerariifolium]
LRELVESERLLSPLNTPLGYACKYTRRIQELLMILQQTCPRITDLGTNLVAVTPKKQNKQDSANKETELEDHPRKVKSSLNKASVVDSRASSSVIKSVSNVNSNLKCASCNGCLFSDNHDKCVVEYINSVNAKSERLLSPLNTPLAYACKYTRRIQELLMILQQTCPRITDLGTNLVAVTPKNQNKQVRRTSQITKSEKPSIGTSPSPNTPVLSSTGVALVSSASGSQSKDNTKKNRIRRTLKKAKETELEGHPRKVKSSLNKASVVASRAKSSIMGYGDYQIGNVMISRVYYVEGLGHNLFSVGQFCDSDLEVAFRQHTCFIRNLEGVDLLTEAVATACFTQNRSIIRLRH